MEPEIDTMDPMATIAELSRRLCAANTKLDELEAARAAAEGASIAAKADAEKARAELREACVLLKSYVDDYAATAAHQRALRAGAVLQRAAAIVGGAS